jgi:hypothetical protein
MASDIGGSRYVLDRSNLGALKSCRHVMEAFGTI